MSVNQQTLEARGDNVDKAIEKGLAQLGLSRQEVTIEVLDEGSGGFLGIGARDAVVRLTVKPRPAAAPEKAASAIADPPEITPAAVASPKPAATTPPITVAPKAAADTDDEGPAEAEVAMEVVRNLLDKMHIPAEVSIRDTEPDDLTGERRLVVEVEGNDLGVLIGPHGTTLNSLQYIARLIAGHILRQRPYFIVDVEGYRLRREQALTRLAQRMAEKATKNQRPVTLEPMPANERRIIHIALRSNPAVYTESTGEGQRRRVRILLKK
jgi:spoIIIJ-associated protein